MKNCGKSVLASCDDLDIIDCDVFNSCDTFRLSFIVGFYGVLTHIFLNIVVTKLCNEHLLVGTMVRFEEDAFELYNGYAYKLGFSIHKGRQMSKAGSDIKCLKQFIYYKEGKKCNKEKVNKCYSKIDVRTNCKAMIEFRLNNESSWTMSKHDINYNHELYLENQRHLMRSQRADSGVSIVAGLRVSMNQVEVHRTLSSQSSETNNHAISRRLSKMSTLCDSYQIFVEVIFNGEATTNIEDFRCNQGCVEMRWTKNIVLSRRSTRIDNIKKVNKKDIGISSVWRRQMIRKFSDLISAKNEEASSNIKYPIDSHAKRERNIRKKSIVEIWCNQAKGRRKNALMMSASRTKMTVQSCDMCSNIVEKWEAARNLSVRILYPRVYLAISFNNLVISKESMDAHPISFTAFGPGSIFQQQHGLAYIT
ncbi:hypothetical protein M9H77_21856 [Catharanthus roseus]|uniref:Uncharacterized protein n=1 Tax=Catharanthus roseus TaxID=4058 RepID=A0ACC0ANJ2_CATRO|nr:hypothetical protein M9H77_21856 [Catharanthus roseus]